MGSTGSIEACSDAVPAELDDDATIRSARPQMATILGVAPLAPAAPRAPIAVTTDAIARLRGVEPIAAPHRRLHVVRELLARIRAWLR